MRVVTVRDFRDRASEMFRSDDVILVPYTTAATRLTARPRIPQIIASAGSAQIAALPLIAAGAPMWVVWVTTLCVSLRFMAFSFHYRPYFAHLPRRRRIALSFLMGDTNFALFIRRFPELVPGEQHEDYFLGSAAVTFGA